MENISTFVISKFSLKKTLIVGLIFILILTTAGIAFAASTSNFQQEITAGTLAVDIVDGSFAPVGSPSVTLDPTAFSFSCQTTTGVFGTATQQIYIENPDAADNGFTVTLAGSSPTAVWDSAGTDFDFNDPTTAGCTDGGDTDTVGGQMTVDASVGTLATGNCGSCNTTNITLGASDSFEEGATNSITLLTAASGANDIGDWTVQDIDISQTIPAEQAAANDYDINMTLSIITS